MSRSSFTPELPPPHQPEEDLWGDITEVKLFLYDKLNTCFLVIRTDYYLEHRLLLSVNKIRKDVCIKVHVFCNDTKCLFEMNFNSTFNNLLKVLTGHISQKQLLDILLLII